MSRSNVTLGRQTHEEQIDTRELPAISTRAIALVALLVLLVFAVLFIAGYLPHRSRVAEADRLAAAAGAPPIVDVAHPRRAEPVVDLVLPGDARAMQQTAIYPRASGYLKRTLVDIGDRVKQGQLLAEIDTPEIDAELNEARATLEQTKTSVTKSQADLDLAQSTLTRFEKTGSGAITPQELDEKRAAVKQAQSALESAKANVVASQAAVQRLTDMQGFQKVFAPFAGVVATRNYDVGALLSPTDTGPGKEIFRLEQTSTLRVFVNVPQSYATSLKTGADADFTVTNFPGKVFKGKVTRSAGAIDPATRTLRFQIDVDNPDLALLGGMYGQIKLHVVQDKPPLLVPTTSMLYQPTGTQVAVVDGNKVHFQPVTVGRDFGQELEILGGLSGEEQVITNPSQRLGEGTEVQVVAPAATQPH